MKYTLQRFDIDRVLNDLEKFELWRKRRLIKSAAIGITCSYVVDIILLLSGNFGLLSAAWAILKAVIICALLVWRSRIKVEQDK